MVGVKSLESCRPDRADGNSEGDGVKKAWIAGESAK